MSYELPLLSTLNTRRTDDIYIYFNLLKPPLGCIRSQPTKDCPQLHSIVTVVVDWNLHCKKIHTSYIIDNIKISKDSIEFSSLFIPYTPYSSYISN